MLYRLFKVVLRMSVPGRFEAQAPALRQTRNDPGQPAVFPSGFKAVQPPP